MQFLQSLSNRYKQPNSFFITTRLFASHPQASKRFASSITTTNAPVLRKSSNIKRHVASNQQTKDKEKEVLNKVESKVEVSDNKLDEKKQTQEPGHDEAPKQHTQIVSRVRPLMNSFSSVWKAVAMDYNFKQLTFTTRPSEEYIKQHTFSNFKIMHETTTSMLVMKNDIKYKDIIVLQDGKHNNRYFVGVSFHDFSCSYVMAGMFLYFGNNGQSKVEVCTDIVMEYDWRNGKVWGHLYNQSLVFAFQSRDYNDLRFQINCLNHQDMIIAQSYYTSSIQPRFARDIETQGRHMVVTTKDQEKLYVDLGSVKVENDNILLSYSTKESTHKEEEYGNGYPENCVKCGSKTHNAIFETSDVRFNLGDSFCKECMIRYSKSEQSWKCSEIHTSGRRLCCKRLDASTNYTCNEKHSAKPSVTQVPNEETIKHPIRYSFIINQ